MFLTQEQKKNDWKIDKINIMVIPILKQQRHVNILSLYNDNACNDVHYLIIFGVLMITVYYLLYITSPKILT